VYVAAPSRDIVNTSAGIAATRALLPASQSSHSDDNDAVKYHELDLLSIATARDSARRLAGQLSRLDILICNAGVAMVRQNELSPDGYEKSFAVNYLGHYVFVDGLLDLVKQTAAKYGDARIVVTSSNGYKMARKIGYDALTTRVPEDGSKFADLDGAFKRYCVSKLASLYLAVDLDRRLQHEGHKNVFVNACHPGNAVATGLGDHEQPIVNHLVGRILKAVLYYLVGHSAEDAAKTQTWLATSAQVREQDQRGGFWIPVWTWVWRRFASCRREELAALGADEGEQAKLQKWTLDAIEARAAR
jgi:NAD(P)-dependent dehydrogenase (short-subunit alcohol dehydrogenase family)